MLLLKGWKMKEISEWLGHSNIGTTMNIYSHIDMEPVQFPRYDEMMREFALIIAGDMENPNSYDYELMVFRTVLRCCGVID